MLLLTFSVAPVCLAQQTSPSQIQRSQEILEKEEALRKRIEGRTFLIETITVEGVTLINKEQIEKIVQASVNKQFNKKEIDKLIQALKDLYKQHGYDTDQLKIDYSVDERNLIINIKDEPTDS